MKLDDPEGVFKWVLTDIDAVALFAPTSKIYEYCESSINTFCADVTNSVEAEQFIELPISFSDYRDRIEFGITGALDQGFISESDVILCAGDLFEGLLTRVSTRERSHSKQYDFFARSKADQSVIQSALRHLLKLGKRGRKNDSIGALFVIGDSDTLTDTSRPLSYNPFSQSEVQIEDPFLGSVLTEFSKLDGAFIVSDTGEIVSSYRYLEPSLESEYEIPKGLGTRHNAAAAITAETEAIALAISESDGRIRGFKGGELYFNLDPELY